MSQNELIANFLDDNFEAFQDYLDTNSIEPSEAEVIIARLNSDTE